MTQRIKTRVRCGDELLRQLWSAGGTLDDACAKLGKTPTSVAHTLVRLGLCNCREEVNALNRQRGGVQPAALEIDAHYTIYLIRSPITSLPVYVGQSQNFRKRRKAHIRRFAPLFGTPPLIEEIARADTYQLARQEERRQIARLEAQGFALLNILDRD